MEKGDPFEKTLLLNFFTDVIWMCTQYDDIAIRDYLIKNFNSFEVFMLDDGLPYSLPYRYLIRETNGAIWIVRMGESGKRLESKVIIFPPGDL